jgi:hypothetical protein
MTDTEKGNKTVKDVCVFAQLLEEIRNDNCILLQEMFTIDNNISKHIQLFHQPILNSTTLKTLSTRTKCTTTSDHQSDLSDDTYYGQTTTISAPSPVNNDNATTSLQRDATTASDNDRVSLDDHGNSNSIHFSICPPESMRKRTRTSRRKKKKKKKISELATGYKCLIRMVTFTGAMK